MSYFNYVENEPDWKNPISVLSLKQAFLEMEQMSTNMGSVIDYEEYKEKKVVVSEDGKNLFGVFSQKTEIIPHVDLLEMVGKAYHTAFNDIPLIKVHSRSDGAQIAAELTLPPDFIIHTDPADRFEMKILLFNNYRVVTNYKIRVGALQLVCANGLVIGTDVSKMNTKALMNAYKANRLDKAITAMIDQTKEVTVLWDQWKQQTFPRPLMRTALTQMMPKRFIKPVLENLPSEMSKYELYCHLTARSTHDVDKVSTQQVIHNRISDLFYGNRIEKLLESDTTLQQDVQTASTFFDDSSIKDTVTETEFVG